MKFQNFGLGNLKFEKSISQLSNKLDTLNEETDLKCNYKSNDDKVHGDIKYRHGFTTLWDYEIFTGIIKIMFAVHLKHSSFLAFGLQLMFSL